MPRRFVERATPRPLLPGRADVKVSARAPRSSSPTSPTASRILPTGGRVLDLGAAPGGWSVVARSGSAPAGRWSRSTPARSSRSTGSGSSGEGSGTPSSSSGSARSEFDVVVSDMSPRISGAYGTDHARSVSLVRDAFDPRPRPCSRRAGRSSRRSSTATWSASSSGSSARRSRAFRRTKPPASREPSSEIYLVGLGFRPDGRRSAPTGRAGAVAPGPRPI